MSYSLYKRPRSPFWWVKAPKLNEAGKVVGYQRESTKRTVKAEAHKIAAMISKREADFGQLSLRQAATLTEAGSMYVSELKALKKESSAETYAYFLSRVGSINPRINGSLPVSALDRNFLMEIRRKRISEGYKPGYINNELAFWTQVYNKAKNDYNMAVKLDVNFTKLKLSTTQKTRYLLEGEEEALLGELSVDREVSKYCPPERRSQVIKDRLQDQYDLVVLLLDTGARLGEIRRLTWTSIDVSGFQWLNLWRPKVQNESKLLLTERSQHILKRRWLRNGNRSYVFGGYGKGDKPRSKSTRGIRKAVDRAGLNSDSLVDRYGVFTVHSFRHTFASKMCQGGMSLFALSKILGHADIKTTQRYAHMVVEDASKEAVAILNRA
jgi:integrase